LFQVETAERLLVIATTMATYSAYRLLQLAHQKKKPILILNLGPTRADGLDVTKIELPCGDALRSVAKQLWYDAVTCCIVKTDADPFTSHPQDAKGKDILAKLDE
ncbi:hypothetical protein FRC17_008232, partial [Serendipita sp. 399]